MAEQLYCEIGKIEDISGNGARVLCDGFKSPVQLGHNVPISFSIAGKRIKVNGLVVWTKRASLRQHQVGLEFLEVPPRAQDAIQDLIEVGFIRTAEERANGKTAEEEPPTPDLTPQLTRRALEPYFQTLGLQLNADPGTIKQAYHSLAKQWHPDHCNEPDAAGRFQEIQEAYQALKRIAA